MKLFKFLRNILSGVIILILIALIFQYVINVKYTFPEPHPFKGEFIYNPYRNFDMSKSRRANFHSHDRKFFGNEKNATMAIKGLDSLYRYLGYDIISISDYQSINYYESKNKWFVPVYEHGFQYYKTHQLVLNAKKVSWLDFPFRQTLSNKQFVIDQLKQDTTSVITIVHPIYIKAYSFRDFKYLNNYNCLEIANHERLFSECYDTILSEGHPVFVMADDDGHHVTDMNNVGSSFNLVNSDLLRDSVLYALSTGRSIGVKFNLDSFTTNEEKKTALSKLPDVKAITFNNDTITVSLNKPVKAIKFIGQRGTERKKIANCSTGSYFFGRNDTYIRIEIECNDGTIYFFNPFFRFNGIKLKNSTSSINVFQTWAWRMAALVILILTLLIWRYKNICIATKK
jgi:hypothetical protein